MMKSIMLWRRVKPQMPEEWAVIAWTSILLFVGIGLAGLYFSMNFPPDKADLALRLRYYSFAFLALAAGIYAVRRFVV